MNKIGESTLPCFTPVVIPNQLLSSICVFTLQQLSTNVLFIALISLVGTSYSLFPRILHNISLGTRSNAFSKSIKAKYAFLLNSCLFTHHLQCKNQINC